MTGAIIGDIVGSRFEFRNHSSKEFEFFHKDCTFTDDTVMTCAVAEALMRCKGNYDNLFDVTVKAMHDIGRKYPDCGYGGRFIRWMFSDDPKPYNSLGNGSAMRVSPVGFAADSIEEAKELSYKVTAVTHNHPEGIMGAEATAVAIVLARQGKSKEEIISYIEENYYDLNKTCDELRHEINGHHGQEICRVTLPQAFVCFKESVSFEDCIRSCVSIGGDTDTIGAIAGAVAGAYYGIPEEMSKIALGYLTPELKDIVKRFSETFAG